MKIIKADSDNLYQLAELFDLYRQFYDQTSDQESALKFLSERISKKESEIFISLDGEGNASGFTQLYPYFTSVGMKRAWILNDLFVKKEYRKKGVAEALINAVREFAEKSDSAFVMLETQKTNTDAARLYERTGFKKDEEHFYFYLNV
ncbi:MAG: GNAT family N-acetyltransferase [Bacteroidetes bacterium]|nr:GNAT family N-acetyltransferase [Bacteroidota bacterium]